MAPKNLVLTEGDVEVFRWLWMLRVLTLDQIRRLRYYQPDNDRLSSIDNVRKRVARLVASNYLCSQDILQEKSMSLQRVYLLGREALAPLRHRYGIEQRRLYQWSGINTLQYIHHALWVTEFATRVVESARGSTLIVPDLAPCVAPFIHTHMVGDATKRRHTERYVTQENVPLRGHIRIGRIRPDLVFGLQQNGRSRLYFLEADRGSEGHAQIAKKLTAYDAYSRLGHWKRYIPHAQAIRVLVMTTTARRVTLLQRSLAPNLGFHLTAFSTLEQVQEKNALFDPIWTQGEMNLALVRSVRSS